MWMLLKRQSPPSARRDSVDLLPLPSASVSASASFFEKNFLLSPVASVLLLLCFYTVLLLLCFCSCCCCCCCLPFFCLLSFVLSPFHVCSLPLVGPPFTLVGPPLPFLAHWEWRKDNMRKKFVIEQLKRRTTQPQLSDERDGHWEKKAEKQKQSSKISVFDCVTKIKLVTSTRGVRWLHVFLSVSRAWKID